MSLGLLLLTGLAAALPLRLDFDVDEGGMLPGGDPGQWEWGAPSTGPALEAEGAVGRVWATRLDRDTMHEADDTLELPSVVLSGAGRPALGLRHWYDIHPSDAAQVEGRVDGVWTPLSPIYAEAPGWSGRSEGWRTDWFDLSGLGDTAALRLRFTSDAAGAAPGWYIAEISISDGDPVPPQITITSAPTDTTELVGPYILTAELQDDVAVVGADIVWIANGGVPTRSAMAELLPGLWTGGIPGAVPGTALAWWIEATDGANSAVSPAESFRVYLPAPTNLVGPTGRVVATEATLRWIAPEAPFTVESYQIYRQSTLIGTSVGPEATVPLEGPVDQLSVSANFWTPAGRFEGDRSEGILIEANVPRLDPLDPGLAWQGDSLRLSVSGSTLLLDAADLELSLGEGVEIGELDVLDVDHMSVELRVEADAPVGPRDLRLRSGAVDLHVPEAFWVEDGDARPRISRISPSQITAGEEETLCLRFNQPLGGPAVAVDVGEGVVVNAVRPRWEDGGIIELYVDVVVPPNAAPGQRRPIVDDGQRLWRGPGLEVVLPLVAATPACATAGAAPAGAGLAVAIGAALGWAGRARRRRVGGPPPQS
jgi:hypothetical protein